MTTYTPVIGMEVHVELKTKSKMFCDSCNGLGLEKEPNIHICPVCTGQPGTLPVPNEQAIRFVQMAGLALHCELAQESKFDRKNYFYPDLPKGYQISQFDQPLCGLGWLDVNGKKIGITRIHMEEDTGKLVHTDGSDFAQVDFNRSGVPLMELVTEPDITSGKEARLFCQRLQQVFRYLGISDADMEKGQMRCEVNISLFSEGQERLSGTKVEIKNLNSFRSVEKAVDFEIDRQTDCLDAGEKIVQETRGWHDGRQMTISQRVKESAHDYRYFPEPDIPPMSFSLDYFEGLRRSLPELPDAKQKRFLEEYGISQDNLDVVVSDKMMADYFEEVVSEVQEKIQSREIVSDEKKVVRLAANYLVSELQKHLVREKKTVRDCGVSPENFAELVGLVADGSINSSVAQKVLDLMLHGDDDDPSHIIDAHGLAQVSDVSALETIVEDVLSKNQQSVDDFKSGKENALKFLMGQVMKETKGAANPQVVQEILRKKIGG